MYIFLTLLFDQPFLIYTEKISADQILDQESGASFSLRLALAYIFGRWKGSWGQKLHRALGVSYGFEARGHKNLTSADPADVISRTLALTPFCNHVILHLTILLIHELALREKDERLVSCFAFFRTRSIAFTF